MALDSLILFKGMTMRICCFIDASTLSKLALVMQILPSSPMRSPVCSRGRSPERNSDCPPFHVPPCTPCTRTRADWYGCDLYSTGCAYHLGTLLACFSMTQSDGRVLVHDTTCILALIINWSFTTICCNDQGIRDDLSLNATHTPLRIHPLYHQLYTTCGTVDWWQGVEGLLVLRNWEKSSSSAATI